MRDWNDEIVGDGEARDQVELLKHQAEPVAAQCRALGIGEVGDRQRRRAVISPPSAASSPAIRCSSVLLPLPDSPVSATLSPAASVEIDAAQHRDLSSPAER